MREYERACRCCSWRYSSDPDKTADQEPYCGPCGRAREFRGYPLDAPAQVMDEDFRRFSGHVCQLLFTAEELRLADRALARERRDRWPDVQREEYEGGRD